MQASTHEAKEFSDGKYIGGGGDPGPYGGGTYTGANEHEQTMRQYEEVFGPAARDIRFDSQRNKRHQRWHLPDALKGPNLFLTDRIDGLITDATNSPFTTVILPYKYVENPDAKLKWNVWSFDEGMASRVPYESAARVLTQTKRSFAAYTVRQGLAITMEHNFMKSPAGMENFRNQVRQMVGSIQYTNDLDVHMALIQAPSYARTIAEKYHGNHRTAQQTIRQYVDLFGIVQKNPNAVDLLIEEAKAQMRNWGSQEPNFLLCNGKLTLQLTMSPEKTNYLTQGIDGVKRLRTGPDIPSYRGVNIIKSRSFSMETNMPPRDVLRRRVRVAEYYWVKKGAGMDDVYEFYDQGRDSWVGFTVAQLLKMAENNQDAIAGTDYTDPQFSDFTHFPAQHFPGTKPPPAPPALPAPGAPGIGAAAGSVPGSATTLDMDNWSFRPYNMKIGLLSSIGGLGIKSGDSTLHCDAKFRGGEAAFSQLIMQTVYISDDAHLKPHVLASAMLGGGLFCDTTFHFARGSSYEFPVCNWAALDIRRVYTNGLNPVEALFKLQKPSEKTLDSTYEHLRAFLPYQPNNYQFGTVYAQNTDNGINTREPEQFIAAVFANTKFEPKAINALLEDLTVPVEIKMKCHEFITPFNGQYEEDNKTYKAQVKEAMQDCDDNGRFNPYSTVLLGMLMATMHPDSQVRAQLDRKLTEKFSGPTWQKTFGKNLRPLFVKGAGIMGGQEPSELGAKLNNAFWSGSPSRSFVNEQSELGTTLIEPVDIDSVSDERICALFALIASKRMFCGAPRFTKGGDTDCGLALLNRSYAKLYSNTGRALGSNAANQFGKVLPGSVAAKVPKLSDVTKHNLLIVRPNIEHEMLGMILGRGGTEELGATLWGQTELSCFDDSQHGIWGMSYKYHERAQVFNEKNMIRTWDIAFDGYNGGMGTDYLKWDDKKSMDAFRNATENFSEPYQGVSMLVMAIPTSANPNTAIDINQLPNPLVWYDRGDINHESVMTDPEGIHRVVTDNMRITKLFDHEQLKTYLGYMQNLPNFADFDRLRKLAGVASAANESTAAGCMAFQGSMRVRKNGAITEEVQGSGHLGPSYVGVAAVREGKGVLVNSAPTMHRLV